MRQILLLHILLLSVTGSFAQQLPQYTYFTYNYLNYNPAVTGYTQCLEMRLGYRRQWMGFEGAPRTAFATVHGKFGQKRHNFHGIGAVVETDDAGPFSYTSLFLNYAYHMRVAKGYTLSSGVGVGFTQFRMDYGSMTLEQQNDDPVLTGSVRDFIFPQINAGLWLYKSDRFYGLSMRQVKHNDVDGIGSKVLRRHLTLAHGRAIKMSDDLTFKPAVLLNYVGKSRASLEGQALIDFKQKFSLGAAFRSGNGISGLLRIDAIRYVTIAYAYDLTMSKMRYDGANTHEIMLGIRACADKDRYHVPCAAYD